MNSAPAVVWRGRIRGFLLASWLLLIAVLTVWWLLTLRWPPGLSALSAGLLILPLILLLPAVSRGSTRASAAATLLLIPYIGWGVTETVANPDARLFAGISVLAALLTFILLIVWLRILRSA